MKPGNSHVVCYVIPFITVENQRLDDISFDDLSFQRDLICQVCI